MLGFYFFSFRFVLLGGGGEFCFVFWGCLLVLFNFVFNVGKYIKVLKIIFL